MCPFAALWQWLLHSEGKIQQRKHKTENKIGSILGVHAWKIITDTKRNGRCTNRINILEAHEPVANNVCNGFCPQNFLQILEQSSFFWTGQRGGGLVLLSKDKM